MPPDADRAHAPASSRTAPGIARYERRRAHGGGGGGGGGGPCVAALSNAASCQGRGTAGSWSERVERTVPPDADRAHETSVAPASSRPQGLIARRRREGRRSVRHRPVERPRRLRVDRQHAQGVGRFDRDCRQTDGTANVARRRRPVEQRDDCSPTLRGAQVMCVAVLPNGGVVSGCRPRARRARLVALRRIAMNFDRTRRARRLLLEVCLVSESGRVHWCAAGPGRNEHVDAVPGGSERPRRCVAPRHAAEDEWNRWCAARSPRRLMERGSGAGGGGGRPGTTCARRRRPGRNKATSPNSNRRNEICGGPSSASDTSSADTARGFSSHASARSAASSHSSARTSRAGPARRRRRGRHPRTNSLPSPPWPRRKNDVMTLDSAAPRPNQRNRRAAAARRPPSNPRR